MKYDLTRWNRAGLKKVRYVGGNAATYLEDLRQDLLARFPAWGALDATVAANETIAQRNARLERQYQEIRREWGWEIARSFARACHVLTEYLDAYANEQFLGTATQWDNVRRLVQMIGYQPAPPASASTPLVLLAKSGQAGTVAAGFQVSYTPKQGAPVIFETLEDLGVDAQLSALRLAKWNWSPAPVSSAVWQLGEKQECSAGELVLLRNSANAQAFAVKVSSVSAARQLTLGAGSWDTWSQGDAWLWFNPAAIHKPRLNGTGVVRLPAGHGLAVGDRIGWQQSGTWRYDSIIAVDAENAQFAGATLPTAGTALYKVQTINADATGTLRFPATYLSISTTASGAASAPSSGLITTYSSTDYGFSSSYKQINASAGIATLYMVPQGAAAVASVQTALPAGEFVFPGNPGDLASGDVVVGETVANVYSVLTVKEVIKREADFSLNFVSAPSALIRLYGPFKDSLRPVGHDVNNTALVTPLVFEASTLPAALVVGRRVVLDQVDAEGETVRAHAARIKSVDFAKGEIALDTMPAAAGGYTLGNTLVRANVALAGHGESKPAKVLGSGDATRSYQSFVLAEKDVAFVADPTMAAGVAAAIEVTVGEQTWQQVSTLDDSEPADPHYTARLTDEGYVQIAFGDGQHGRRLPTGSSNVRVRYRIGMGLSGNVAPGGLEKPVKPHVLIDKVRQPLLATGGNDREPISSLRSNAPAALFTLERAVSLDDYARLAQRNSSVWQARAFRLANQGAQQERIRVVVVPAGGGALGDLATTLRDFLEGHDLPGAKVDIVNHVPVPFDVSITVQVDSSQYVPEEVQADVRAALLDGFYLKNRRLGQALYPSEVIAIVERVEGVINSQCQLGDGAFASVLPAPRVLKTAAGQIRLIQPEADQVLVLDEMVSSVGVQVKEFSL